MNKSILCLIGITDTLLHLLETDRTARKRPSAAAARQRLERMRKTLLAEGVRHSRILGAARDSIFEVTTQLGAQLSATNGSRDVEWVLHGLLTADSQDVEPPPLPSSSSSSSTGPKSLDARLLALAGEIVAAAARTEAKPATMPDGRKI